MTARAHPIEFHAKVMGLSARKTDVLKHLLEGRKEKDVAAILRISPHTVHVYVKSIYKAFAVKSRAQLLFRVYAPSVTTSKSARRANSQKKSSTSSKGIQAGK
jgi:DNA-binding CsgD family transcriptional regulator